MPPAPSAVPWRGSPLKARIIVSPAGMSPWPNLAHTPADPLLQLHDPPCGADGRLTQRGTRPLMMPPAAQRCALARVTAEGQDHRVPGGDATLAQLDRDGAMPVPVHPALNRHRRVRDRPGARQRPDRRAAWPHRDDPDPGAHRMQGRICSGHAGRAVDRHRARSSRIRRVPGAMPSTRAASLGCRPARSTSSTTARSVAGSVVSPVTSARPARSASIRSISSPTSSGASSRRPASRSTLLRCWLCPGSARRRSAGRCRTPRHVACLCAGRRWRTT